MLGIKYIYLYETFKKEVGRSVEQTKAKQIKGERMEDKNSA